MTTTKRRRVAGEGSIASGPRSDGRWVGRLELGWTEAGRQRKYVYGKTRAECASKLREAQQRVAVGLPMPDERASVGSYLEGWISGLDLRVRGSTARRYTELLRGHVIPGIGKVKLARLTPQRIEALLTDRLASGLSPRTVWHIRACLRGALADAVRAGDLSRNPASLARPPRVENYRVEPMSPRHAHAILDAVAGTDVEVPVAVALWTGLRQGELLGLRWSNIDFEARQLSVVSTLQRRGRVWLNETTKTPKSRRTVALADPVVDTLVGERARQREARLLAGPAWSAQWPDLVFTDARGLPVMPTAITHRFAMAQRQAGLKPVRWHDLRHAAATLMLAGGVDLKVVSELLGHSTIATTANVYAGVLDSLKVDAAERMARLLAR
jgi:integrase